MRPELPERQTHDSHAPRLDHRSTALDIASGQVIIDMTDRHRAQEFRVCRTSSTASTHKTLRCTAAQRLRLMSVEFLEARLYRQHSNSTPLPVSRMWAVETTAGATSRQARVQHLLTRAINPSAEGDRFEASPMTRSPTYDRNGDP